jgi:dihydroorotase-like cyclic amidohydrolase
VNASSLHSQGKHTPYWGRELVGRNRLTMVAGRIVLNHLGTRQ